MKSEVVVPEDTRKKVKKSFWGNWKIDEADLRNQVENYKTLKITKSYRGIATLIISGLLLFSLVFDFVLSSPDLVTLLYGIAIYLPFLFFTYKGHRWAIIILMLLWTYDAGYGIYQAATIGEGNFIMTIIWWLIIMPNLWKALKVEESRKKIKQVEKIQSVQTTQETSLIFCRYCGKPLDADSKFCTNCGKSINATH